MRARLLLAVATVVATMVPAGAARGEVAGGRNAPAQAFGSLLAAGQIHSCAVNENGELRCWGANASGQLGLGVTVQIGDNEPPGVIIPVPVGAGRRVLAVSAGTDHTCALLDTHQVRCWGGALFGQLGQGNTVSIGDNETPDTVAPVKLGAGRTALAITSAEFFTCALLDTHQVRCWGKNNFGQLGRGNTDNVGDDESPGSVPPVNLGPGRTALAVTAGTAHACAILDTHQVRCWGLGDEGRLGRGNTDNIGDDESPGSVAPVNLGPGRTALAVAAGGAHTCAILDNHALRCWGSNSDGELGTGVETNVGDDEAPGSVAPIKLGAGRTAVAVATGGVHTCAVLDNGALRCWGGNLGGQTGLGDKDVIGDNETPDTVPTVNVGNGRVVTAVATGAAHTCALLDNGRVRCWGINSFGELGLANKVDVGDDETPNTVPPVDLRALLPRPGPLAVQGATVTEPDAGTVNAKVVIKIAVGAPWPVKVNVATSDGSAHAGSDYAAKSVTVTFAAGETAKTVPIAIKGDTAREPNETFTVKLSAPVPVLPITPATATVTIRNDD